MNRKIISIFSLMFILLIFNSSSHAADPISEAMCRDTQSFRSCFGYSLDACLKSADQAVNKCLQKMTPPEALKKDPNGSGEWAVMIAHCAEDEFENENSPSFKSDKSCSDLMEQRMIYRAKASALRNKKLSSLPPKLSNQIILLPVILSVMFSLLYLRKISRRQKVKFRHGFVAWILFVFGGGVGDILSHQIFPFLYKEIGDNPLQVAGVTFSLMLSFIAVPILFLVYKKISTSHSSS